MLSPFKISRYAAGYLDVLMKRRLMAITLYASSMPLLVLPRKNFTATVE